MAFVDQDKVCFVFLMIILRNISVAIEKEVKFAFIDLDGLQRLSE